jgi:hypothetical protein
MQHSSKLILGGLKLPLDERSGVAVIERKDFKFRFSYRQITYSVHFTTLGEVSTLDIVGDIGPMPFSAESALARAELQTVLDAANAHLGEVFRIDDGRIKMIGTVAVAPPVTAAGMITSIAHFLLRRRPYLETIAVFLFPPGERRTSGEVALRPGWRGADVIRRGPNR